MDKHNALRRNVSGAIEKRAAGLSTPERHQLKVARDSMTMNCTMLAIMGGITSHHAAAQTIAQLTGAIVGIDADCTCTEVEGS